MVRFEMILTIETTQVDDETALLHIPALDCTVQCRLGQAQLPIIHNIVTKLTGIQDIKTFWLYGELFISTKQYEQMAECIVRIQKERKTNDRQTPV